MDFKAFARIRLLLSVLDRRNLAVLIFSYFTIFVLYSLTYNLYVYPFNSYAEYKYDFSLARCVFSLSFLYFIASIFDFRAGISDFFLNVFVIVYLVPALVLFSFGGYEFVYLLWMLGSFALMAAASRLPVMDLAETGFMREERLSHLLLVFALAAVAVSSYLNGFRFVFNIYEVYQHRAVVNEHVTPAYTYITSVTSKVVLPFAAVVSLSCRRYFGAFLAVCLSVVLFSITGHKGVLFYTVISVGLYVYVSVLPKAYHLNMMFIALLLVAAVDAVAISYMGAGGVQGMFVDLIVRRGLFTPPLLDYLYIDYFTHHAWYWWSSSRITLGLIPPPYPVTAPFLIGTEYFQKPTLSANSGFIGAGFSQAGWFGMTIYAVGLGVVISVANAMEGKFSRPVLVSLLFVPIVTAMTGADLLTTFLTHGMLLSFVILVASGGQKGKA